MPWSGKNKQRKNSIPPAPLDFLPFPGTKIMEWFEIKKKKKI